MQESWCYRTNNGSISTEILDYLVNPARHSSGPIVASGKAISGRSFGGKDWEAGAHRHATAMRAGRSSGTTMDMLAMRRARPQRPPGLGMR